MQNVIAKIVTVKTAVVMGTKTVFAHLLALIVVVITNN